MGQGDSGKREFPIAVRHASLRSFDYAKPVDVVSDDIRHVACVR